MSSVPTTCFLQEIRKLSIFGQVKVGKVDFDHFLVPHPIPGN